MNITDKTPATTTSVPPVQQGSGANANLSPIPEEVTDLSAIAGPLQPSASNLSQVYGDALKAIQEGRAKDFFDNFTSNISLEELLGSNDVLLGSENLLIEAIATGNKDTFLYMCDLYKKYPNALKSVLGFIPCTEDNVLFTAIKSNIPEALEIIIKMYCLQEASILKSIFEDSSSYWLGGEETFGQGALNKTEIMRVLDIINKLSDPLTHLFEFSCLFSGRYSKLKNNAIVITDTKINSEIQELNLRIGDWYLKVLQQKK